MKITDHQKLARDVPLYGLLMSDNEGIQSQEAQGQHQVVNSCMLPTEGLLNYAVGGKYAALGFIVGAVDSQDPLFTVVTLPDGWTKTPNSHSMYTDIRDAQNNVRLSFFYKASAHDRKADIGCPCTRYRTQPGPETYGSVHSTYLVIDTKKAVWASDGKVCAEAVIHTAEVTRISDEKAYQAGERLEALADAWLDTNYPLHSDPFAYWEQS